ncbi:MAG: UDP-N-acetylmuramoyl-L-alanine--D-glutamate ligase [Chloroflexota bacterium]|nr:UDP-N-acetylmuramoyl-L-alanine--D-glutamate ligase [Chloroflexota bacterium]
MGLGLHGGGLGITRWLIGQGAEVTVTDLKTADQLRPSMEALAGQPVRFVLGHHDAADFAATDLVIRNPGVPSQSPYLKIARDHGVPVEMEMGLFFRLCPAPILAITGTKGKTTTTSLTGAIIRRSRPDAVVAGNIAGGSPQWHGDLPALELLPLIHADTPVVLELSSWQLEGLPSNAAPHVAAVTNVLPDHLNRYASMADYAASKALIFEHQGPADTVVLNYDNAITCGFAAKAPGKVAWFSRKCPVQGAFLAGDEIRWQCRGEVTPLASLADVQIPGLHNLENVLAAAALAMVWGASPQDVRAAIRDFPGVPHRLEFVAQVLGVRYYDDTTATTPDATIAALEAFAGGAPIVLIAGGSDKGLAFDHVAQAIAQRVKSVVLLGGAGTEKLESALRVQRAGDRIAGRFDSLEEAVSSARGLAAPGEVVLLSPACASFGMFANEFQRGDQFKQLVKELLPA